MILIILRRLILIFPTLIGITFLTFLFIHAIPGDPISVMIGEHGISPERHSKLLAMYGLDQPIFKQYIKYLLDIIHGNLGFSLKNHISVWEEFIPNFKATLELSFCALIFAIFFGIIIGVIAAIKRGSIFDYISIVSSLIGYSMPIFWWGIIVITFFSLHLNITPVSGRISDHIFLDESNPLTGFMLFDTLVWGQPNDFKDAVAHIILPSIVLGTIPLAVIVRITRSSMLEVLNANYIRTARAKGLTNLRIIIVHALRNAILPIITIIGLQMSTLLTGAILTETIFAWPGIGRWLLQAVQQRDYPIIQGGVLLISILIIMINLCIDILYGVINPRIIK
ncbi:MAG: ABC transporter permease subunit [Pantoea sp. Brub]|nr:ABC transporter permease subunit [Pantoea sp. Brub]